MNSGQYHEVAAFARSVTLILWVRSPNTMHYERFNLYYCSFIKILNTHRSIFDGIYPDDKKGNKVLTLTDA